MIAAGNGDVEDDDWIKATVDVLEVFKSRSRSKSLSNRIRRGTQLIVWIPTTALRPEKSNLGRQRRRQHRRNQAGEAAGIGGGRCERCPDVRPRRTYFLAGRTEDGDDEDEDDDGAVRSQSSASATGLIVGRSSSLVIRWTSELARAVRDAANNERRLRLTGKLYQTSGCR